MDRNTIITYEKVRDDAKIIMDCAEKVKIIFEEFNSTINQVGSDEVFLGLASDALKNSFNALKGRFDAYTTTIENFSKMILSATDSTEATEKNIAAAAESLTK